MTAAERWKLFVGATFAPEFGLVGGVGVVWTDRIMGSAEIGDEPTNPKDPFKTDTTSLAFAGFAYNF